MIKSVLEHNGNEHFRKSPRTSYQRVLEHNGVSDDDKERLCIEHEKLNPLVLKKERDTLKQKLGREITHIKRSIVIR